jgi:hypothetical protein
MLLLEGEPNQNNLTVRLLENPVGTGIYACLSHRWDPRTPEVALTKSRLDKFKQGIELNSLYPMLVSAIYVVRQLGVAYLWIDCLCIVQDDEQDWHREAMSMGDVYGNAYVTLFATRCEMATMVCYTQVGNQLRNMTRMTMLRRHGEL